MLSTKVSHYTDALADKQLEKINWRARVIEKNFSAAFNVKIKLEELSIIENY